MRNKLLYTIFLILSFVLASNAASTDTVKQSTDTLESTMQSIAKDMAEFHDGFIPFIVPNEILVEPVDQKVVELLIRTEDKPEEIKNKKKQKLAQKLPFPDFRTGQAICSGAFVTNDGDILTAKHCIHTDAEIFVKTYDSQVYKATVKSTSPIHDLALIHIDKLDTPYFQLAQSVVREEKIFVFGSPLGITSTISTGIIAKLSGDLLLLDCSALPGNSGGPIFNETKELVGILTNVYVVGFGVTHLTVAQGKDAVFFFLKKVYDVKN